MARVNPAKVAAILAAVLQHSAETAQQPAAAVPPTAPVPVPPVWAWSGRQDAMRDRVLWQQRHSRVW